MADSSTTKRRSLYLFLARRHFRAGDGWWPPSSGSGSGSVDAGTADCRQCSLDILASAFEYALKGLVIQALSDVGHSVEIPATSNLVELAELANIRIDSRETAVLDRLMTLSRQAPRERDWESMMLTREERDEMARLFNRITSDFHRQWGKPM